MPLEDAPQRHCSRADPFLLSNSFLKGIKAAIDTDAETLWINCWTETTCGKSKSHNRSGDHSIDYNRSAVIHEPRDFGTVVSMAGITWDSISYHFVDQATVFQTAIIAPPKATDQAANPLLSGWAWRPQTSSGWNFLAYFRDGVQWRTSAADANGRNARAERRGGILQVILPKWMLKNPFPTMTNLP